MVMPVRVGADHSLMSGKMLLAVGKPQRLRPVYGQPVVGCVPWVKGNDIVVALYVLPLVVLAVPHICPYAGEGKIFLPAVEGFQPEVPPGDKPPRFIKDGLHGELVMLKGQIGFGCPVVGVLRTDMLYRCHRLLQSLSALQTLRRQGRKRLPALRRTGHCRVCRIRSDNGQSDLSCCRFFRTAPQGKKRQSAFPRCGRSLG